MGSDTCLCCGQVTEQIGSARWSNGRRVPVCDDCLDSMWHSHDDQRMDAIDPMPQLNQPLLDAIETLRKAGLIG